MYNHQGSKTQWEAVFFSQALQPSFMPTVAPDAISSWLITVVTSQLTFANYIHQLHVCVILLQPKILFFWPETHLPLSSKATSSGKPPWWFSTSVRAFSQSFPAFLFLFPYGLPLWLSHKESACNSGAAGDMGLIPGLGRSPGGGNGNLLQYSCLENPMDKEAWRAIVHRVIKSWTWLTWLSIHAEILCYGKLRFYLFLHYDGSFTKSESCSVHSKMDHIWDLELDKAGFRFWPHTQTLTLEKVQSLSELLSFHQYSRG